jgi:pyruvate dehydrogenase E2 component (dihydrolipoamide acetyltransferase)
MATAVVMPKQGQSVESCIIVSWKKKVSEPIAEDETLCEVETDKALLEVPSPASGVVLALFFEEGDDVPVLTAIAAIGQPGEAVDHLRPDGAGAAPAVEAPVQIEPVSSPAAAGATAAAGKGQPAEFVGVSPRARKLAARKELDLSAVKGSGPGGRIIERDVQAALAQHPPMTPLARTMVTQGGFSAPERGSGVRGRIMAGDLSSAQTEPAPEARSEPVEDEVQTIPVKGTRKVIATRMLESLQTTAQLTLNSSADARELLAYRKRLKESPEALGLQKVTINDFILFVVSRMLLHYPELNALFKDNVISQYKQVHLGFAVDTPRGLVVPVIRAAHQLSLKQIAAEARRLAAACVDGVVKPDELSGGTFSVTNLGNLGIESFTPVLNPPQVGILGVGSINLKPVEVEGEVQFIQHIGLSLTINHQVVDGAPAARFLQAVSRGLAELELWLAL